MVPMLFYRHITYIKWTKRQTRTPNFSTTRKGFASFGAIPRKGRSLVEHGKTLRIDLLPDRALGHFLEEVEGVQTNKLRMGEWIIVSGEARVKKKTDAPRCGWEKKGLSVPACSWKERNLILL